jgi:hypothetical protein
MNKWEMCKVVIETWLLPYVVSYSKIQVFYQNTRGRLTRLCNLYPRMKERTKEEIQEYLISTPKALQ